MSELSSVFVDVEKLDWQPTQFPGIRIKMLWQDEAGQAFTALFKLEPGARLPRHRHMGIEQTFVLEGSLVDDEGACTAVNYVCRPAGSVHTAYSPDGCLGLGIFQQPNEFLDQA